MKTIDLSKKCTSQPLPFLRWAGGKKWLIKSLDKLLPSEGYNSYHEPFLGGASIFFYLQPIGNVYLADKNEELIETYIQIRDNVETVMRHLRRFKNTKEDYYLVRDKMVFKSAASRAARFIYLNQTSFNGIYRVNLSGAYNVPYGYRDKEFFNKDKLRKASEQLNNIEFSSGDFAESIDKVKEGDLVFLDPPYTITHNNNGFFKYNKDLFTKEDQVRLANHIDEIKSKGAFYILTNAAHDEVKKIFSNGDPIIEISRASNVGGKCAKRGVYQEIIVTNCGIGN